MNEGQIQTNLALCFICQKEKKGGTARSKPGEIDSWAKNISKIYKLEGVNIDFNRIMAKISDGEAKHQRYSNEQFSSISNQLHMQIQKT